VADDVGLHGGVPLGAVDPERRGAAARREAAAVVGGDGDHVGLVHGGPVPHPVAELPETHVRVCREVLPASYKQDYCIIYLITTNTLLLYIADECSSILLSYTTLGLSHPWYSSSRICGKSR
jgi:hypothetical protein